MNLLRTQDLVELPDLSSSTLGITIVSLLIGVLGGGLLLRQTNIGLKLLGLIVTVGGVAIAVSQWTVLSGWSLAIGLFAVLLVSGAQLTQGGAKTRPQKAVFIVLAVLALLALGVVLPATVTEPLGTIGDIISAGWNTLLEMFGLADAAVEGV